MLRLLASLCLAFACVSARATTYQMTTASSAEFATVYGGTVAGDTIRFPLNGSATWSTSATIGKALTIDGNGTTLTAGGTLAHGFFYVTGFSSASAMQVTKFVFINTTYIGSDNGALYIADVDLTALRIDYNSFTHSYGAVNVGGSKGVICHNTFTDVLQAISFTGGSVAQQNASWVSMAAGTSDALFVETNTFVCSASYPYAGHQESIGTYAGGKLVVRYNEWDSDNEPGGLDTVIPLLTHGSAAGGNPFGYWEADYNGAGQCRRGQSVVEFYNNSAHGKRVDYLTIFRGSANLVHDNTLDTQSFNPRCVMYEEEQYESSNWTPLRTAWPAEDQVHNSFFWNNTLRLNGVTNTDYVEVNSNSTDYIQLDRDYFLHAPQASGGKESFTGLNGASGSYPTNGTVYPTLGTMTFSSSGANAYFGYVPYTYPYPNGGTPTPDPSTIASTTPTTTQITVVATLTTGGTGAIEYNHAKNGTYAGWQSSASHDFTGLTPSTSYAFKVKARDSATPTPNETTESAVSNVSTLAVVPPAVPATPVITGILP